MEFTVSPSRNRHDDAGFLYDLEETITEIASTIAKFEAVVMLAAASHHKAIKRLVSAAVERLDIPTDDLRARDAGPSVVVDGKGGTAVTSVGDHERLRQGRSKRSFEEQGRCH